MAEENKNCHDLAGIEAQAAAWVARLDAGELSMSDRDQFRAWLDASPLHHRVFAECSALWSQADIFRELIEKRS